MSQQNNLIGTSTPTDLPVKRKRGRPRKDKNLVVKDNSQVPLTPASDGIQNTQEAELHQSTDVDDNMVGRVVSGVVEGTFDSGYLLSVKVGNSSTLLRGVVFQPGKVSPITAANDVAPNAKFYKIRDSHIPAVNPPCQANGSVPRSVHTIEQPLQLQNQVPIAPNQGLPPVLQSSAPFASSNPSASVVFPLNNMPKNVNGASLEGKTTPEQKSEFEILSESSSVSVPLTNISQIEADTLMGGMKVMQQQNSDFRTENQSASSIIPLPDMPNNVSSTFMDGGKVAMQQTPPQFAFENQSLPLLKNLKMVEQDAVMEAFEVPESEVPESESMVSVFPSNKTNNQLSPVENPAGKPEVALHQTASRDESQFLLSEPQTESDPIPLEQAHNDLHNSTSELCQTPVVTYSHPVPIESEYLDSALKSSEPMPKNFSGSNIKLNENTLVAGPQSVTPEPTSEPMDIVKDMPVSPTKDSSHYEQPEPKDNDLSKYETSRNGEQVHDVADNNEAVLRPTPKKEAALPAKPAEESEILGKIESQIASSPIHTTDMDFALVGAQSQC